ncbi:MAG TPA: SIMPL domain-containing protein [Pyrinomonadaceae bacterium]
MAKSLTRAVCAAALCFALASGAMAQEITVRGRLARTVEAGGWLIAAKQKYLLINADRWRNESWFRAGAEVEAQGSVRPDVVSAQMEGTPFEARTLKPAGEGGASDAGDAAQGTGASGVARVVVSGDSTVRSRPDTALITVAVVTQGQTALAAQAENARKSEAVVRAVKAAAGAGAEVETSGYSLQPQYTYRQNEAPLIQGYQARNGVNVTMSDLTKVGAVIDAATSAGANNVENLSFTLRQDRPARDQSLAEATRAAMRKAQVIAQALGGRVTRVIEVQEATDQPRPVPLYKTEVSLRAASSDAAQTPVEIGTLDIRSQVQLVAEITMNR